MTKECILVVEDNVPLLEGIRELLEFSGYRVLTAANGTEGLEVLEDARPDLIVSDIMMPEMDGYEFHANVREREDLVDIPFIFLTARGEKADVRKGKEIGADDYITKPFEDEDLLVAVRAKLTRWEGIKKRQDEEMSGLKHQILLTLSHEFRTPLTYVINYADMLEMEQDSVSPEEFREFMQGIRRGAKRLNQLVEDFLILVELETGEAAEAYLYRRRTVDDTSTWLRVIGGGYKDLAERKGLHLILEVPDDLPPVVVDDTYLADAIGRLLDNAVKFSNDKDGKIWFRALADEEELTIEVEDQGIGIEQQDLKQLFNTFYQIDRAKKEQQGTGSGLAICRGLVAIHGGEVKIRSTYGEGSVASIILPRAPD
jgi:two-component system sensor histidine kinase/response regulator